MRNQAGGRNSFRDFDDAPGSGGGWEVGCRRGRPLGENDAGMGSRLNSSSDRGTIQDYDYLKWFCVTVNNVIWPSLLICSAHQWYRTDKMEQGIRSASRKVNKPKVSKRCSLVQLCLLN